MGRRIKEFRRVARPSRHRVGASDEMRASRYFGGMIAIGGRTGRAAYNSASSTPSGRRGSRRPIAGGAATVLAGFVVRCEWPRVARVARSLLALPCHAVADVALVEDVAGVCRVVAELRAELPDERARGRYRWARARSPTPGAAATPTSPPVRRRPRGCAGSRIPWR